MSGNQTNQIPQPQTVAELNLHLVYLQRDVSKLVEAMPLMATKTDIDSLARRLDGYATQTRRGRFGWMWSTYGSRLKPVRCNRP